MLLDLDVERQDLRLGVISGLLECRRRSRRLGKVMTRMQAGVKKRNQVNFKIQTTRLVYSQVSSTSYRTPSHPRSG